MNQQALSALIWSVADLLRGDFKQSEYGRVILPFTVLRRLDCVLAPTKAAVLAEHRDKEQAGLLYLVVEKFAHIELHPRRVDNVHMGLVFEELIRKGKPQPDSALRDTENVPLSEDVQAWFEREVLPHAPDAWIDHDKTKVGYEIPFNRHFYVFEPPRPLAEIDADLKRSMDRIKLMIEGLAG